MKNITKDLDLRRKRFDQGAVYYGEQGITPQRTKVRAVAQLLTGKDVLSFGITRDKAVGHPLELLLEKGDLFVTTALGLALVIEKDGEPGQAPLLSYPVQAGLHLPAGLKGFENTNAFAIYNGKLQMRTGSSVNYSRISTDDFLFVPEIQPSAVLAASDDAVVSNGVYPAFNIENVLVQLEEGIVLAGTKNQPFELSFPFKNDATFGVPAGYKAYAVLIFDGFIYEGGAVENMKVTKAGKSNPYKDLF